MARNHYCGVDDIPKCCKECNRLDYGIHDEYSSSYYYCESGLLLPTKKQTCKRKPKKQEK